MVNCFEINDIQCKIFLLLSQGKIYNDRCRNSEPYSIFLQKRLYHQYQFNLSKPIKYFILDDCAAMHIRLQLYKCSTRIANENLNLKEIYIL